jgi:methylenetetrahydrofolate dehydrogenase (NADP+)/methenyltetrahydrofolate cyclohydrolase
MILLDGKTVSQQILDSLKPINKSLHVILVGNDPSSLKYVSLKEKKCLEVGVNFVLHHLQDDSSLEDLIINLNNDPKVDGFFIQLPIKNKHLLNLISPQKDVDGLTPGSDFTPAVVVGIIKLLKHYHLNFENKKVVILNDSELIGRPLKKYFPQAILCNDQTKNIKEVTQTADLLISATGVKNIITADMVKDGAVVVDVANGDVDFVNVAPKCSYITPTFGGIGPMTIASLLENLSLVNK